MVVLYFDMNKTQRENKKTIIALFMSYLSMLKSLCKSLKKKRATIVNVFDTKTIAKEKTQKALAKSATYRENVANVLKTVHMYAA